MAYVLSCCSTVDITREHLERRELYYACFHYQLGDKNYTDDLCTPMSDFYQAMVDGADTRTSQVNVEEYEAHFEKFLKEGKDVLHVTLSSGISGTINSARIAAASMEEKYPGRKVHVVDSLTASSGFGLFMDLLADRRDEGMSFEDICSYADEQNAYVHAWFFSSDLTFFIKGGRVSKTAGFFGQMLGICPLLNIDLRGKLIPREKIRPKRKVIRVIVDRMAEHAQDGLNYNGKCYISHSVCLADAQAVAAEVENRFPNLKGKVEINEIGTTIGAHTGPGTVALFFMGDKREVEEA